MNQPRDKVLYSNYFQVSVSQKTALYIYKVSLDNKFDELTLTSDDGRFVQTQLSKLIYKRENDQPVSFNQDHQHSLMINYRIYSTKLVEDKIYDLGTVTLNDQEYNAKAQFLEVLEHDSDEMKQLLGRLFKRMMQKIRLVKFGRKYFDPKQYKDFEKAELRLIQGYDSAISMSNEKVLLQIDSCIKLIRKQNYLHLISKINRESEEFQDMLGGIVQANYGDHQFYRVEGIDFNMSPESSFQTSKGESKTYVQYYKERYNIDIGNPNQPLIKSIRNKGKKNEFQLYLVPELCQPTGETMQHKRDFRLQSDLGKAKNVPAPTKIRQCQDFLKVIEENNKQHMENWGISVNSKPLDVPYTKITPGKLRMANKELDIERDDLDRGTQAPMLKMPFQNGIDRMLVLYMKKSQNLCDQFMNQFQQSVSFMKFAINNAPRCIGIDEGPFSNWKRVIDQNVGAQLIICILPGPKKNGKYYKELKIYLTNVIGVFSQCIIESTVGNQKGLRVVCNKLILKITSKTGGIPYSISDMPDRFSKQPTMLVGIDIYHKREHGKQSVLGFVATVDQHFGKYFHAAELMEEGIDINTKLAQLIKKAIDRFGQQNRIAPTNIVVFRDGVSSGQIQTVIDTEVQGLKAGIGSWGDKTKNTKLAYIVVNKKINAKFFTANNGNLENANSADSGTIIKESQVNDDQNDYYIVSQKAKQGVAIPTHYRAIHNELPDNGKNEQNIKDSINDLQILTYKLCFLYYNCTHAIKIPSPAKLAHRLSNFVGDKYNSNRSDTFIIPKAEITKENSQYFL